MAVRHRRTLIALAATLVLTGGGCAIAEDNDDSTARLAQEQPAAAKTASSGTPASPAPGKKAPAAAEKAQTEVRRNSAAVKSAPEDVFRPVDTTVDPSGEQHVRFHRTHQGLPVLGGDFVVHSDASGNFRSATVAQDQVIDVPATAKISRQQAIKTAGLRGKVEARLVVDALDGKPALAWEITGAEKVVVVDATTGKVRLSYETVHTGEKGTGKGLHVGDVELNTTKRADGVYTLTDPDRGGNTVRDALNNDYYSQIGASAELTDADNAWGDGTRLDRATDGVDVLYSMAKTWDYLQETFGRSGLFNDGKGTTAYVHEFVKQNNAWWSGTCRCMAFGDGDPATRNPYTPIDIVAHEMAHGLTDATADFVYSGESGGLNESSSDIFGTLVEFSAANPADKPDYTISEKTRLDGTPSRWMDEPSKDGKSVSCWTPTTKDLDVHYSSGIGNKFFYNLAVGSGASAWGDSKPCGNAAPVVGIGNDKAARIWYRALTLYMVSNSNYANAREATLSAAADLYGADSVERNTVDVAWRAVGLDGTQLPYGTPSMLPFPDSSPAAEIGKPVRIQAAATDPQKQQLTFSATGLPAGVTIDANGLISGTPIIRGRPLSKITVTDPDGNSDYDYLLWVVKGPPVMKLIAPTMTGYVETPVFRGFGATFTEEPDIDDQPWDAFKVTATGLPEGLDLSVPKPVPGSGLYVASITGIPTKAGSGTTVLTGTDPDGNQVSGSIQWEILPAGLPAEPNNLTVIPEGAGVATLAWEPPTSQAGTSTRTGYVVRVTPGTETKLKASAQTHTVSGLDPRQTYTFSVHATSKAGDGAAKTVTIAPATASLSLSATVITDGQAVTLSGKVLQGSSPIANTTATLEQLAAGSSTWVRVSSVQLYSNGAWQASVRPTVTTAYRLRFDGRAGIWPATSPAPWIAVRYAVSAKPATATPKAGQKITIGGSGRPVRAGTLVTLQHAVGGRWVDLATTRMYSNGAYSFSRAFTRGTWTLRVVVAGGTQNATGISGNFTVKAS
ncbi:M4 family metallopeptidase [Actinoplanes utahensis]|uniref:M4 family metallopeptidase n=1 Tax=Actinoplanes utahensis TaxID=1869 RepID=UPI00068EA9C1|nr:M4 family metallopeptidase [Actinoplanes utahensis]GIF29523.1 hypothetical protein Aut01nite_25090 [Actinoplanes utahensis]